jgi:hypothetical protein
MAYTDAFLFDVFVSFAREDDEPLTPGQEEGWISRLVHDLKISLNLELGEEISVFFDQQHRFDGLPFEYLMDNIRNSAVFLPLISPAYSAKGWTEFRAFMATPGSIGRIAALEILPVKGRASTLEISVATAKSVRFWVSEEGEVRRLSQEADLHIYSLHLARLTNQIMEVLRDLRPKRSGGNVPGPEVLKVVMTEAEKETPGGGSEEGKDTGTSV